MIAKKKNQGQQKQEFDASIQTLSKEMDVIDSFVIRKWKTLLYVGIAGTAVMVLVMVVMQKSRGDAELASAELRLADTAEKLQTLIKEHPGVPSVGLAKLRLAAMLFAKKDYDGALSIYQALAKSSGEGAWGAKINLGYTFEAKADIQNALNSFTSVAEDKAAPASSRCEAAFNAGRLLFGMGKKDEASKMLKACVAERIAIPSKKPSDKPVSWELWPVKAEELLTRI